MIIFDLKCKNAHHFEGWFKNSHEYENQLTKKLISCPVCGSDDIHKLVSGSKIKVSKPVNTDLATLESAESGTENLEQFLQHLKQHVMDNYDDVGNDFAEEAKRIHYGESERRNIHGTASFDDLQELHDEGIDAIPLPTHADKKKLN